MKILALEGALGAFSCCFSDGRRHIVSSTAGNDALEAGLDAVSDVLREARTELRALDRLAVGTGPGSFTGLRIAISYAKGLALAKRLPLVGVSSYDILEPDDAQLPVLTVVAGRIGVVCARLHTESDRRVRCGPVDEVSDEFARLIHSDEITVVGATKDVLAALGERGLNVRTIHNRAAVPAEAVAQLATRYEPAASPHALRPDYGELPAARVPRFP
ncbi:MAG TPA: tRNA (adenosine(37)-N6)-threonylcarbamoyltransferase complex dimerization subunit type 1 TsaB [Candidatus Binatia bacterium]|nr:tRNA (adenosine(37)-N6)-threonylcarbamoyltransferase complex dimerization subunit type 1 TsaB [Candidatus Binatia bacterium]